MAGPDPTPTTAHKPPHAHLAKVGDVTAAIERAAEPQLNTQQLNDVSLRLAKEGDVTAEIERSAEPQANQHRPQSPKPPSP
jgi:hypothetical protein